MRVHALMVWSEMVMDDWARRSKIGSSVAKGECRSQEETTPALPTGAGEILHLCRSLYCLPSMYLHGRISPLEIAHRAVL